MQTVSPSRSAVRLVTRSSSSPRRMNVPLTPAPSRTNHRPPSRSSVQWATRVTRRCGSGSRAMSFAPASRPTDTRSPDSRSSSRRSPFGPSTRTSASCSRALGAERDSIYRLSHVHGSASLSGRHSMCDQATSRNGGNMFNSGKAMRRWTLVSGLVLLASLAVGTSGPSAATAKPRWVVSDLGTLGRAWRDSGTVGVNENGQITGTSGTASGKQHAFLWQSGKMTDLGTLGGRDSSAVSLNDRGQVIGTSLTAKPARTHAFLWQSGKMTDLGTLGGRSSRPRAINNHGQIVGESFAASGKVHAFLWQNGKMSDLGTLGGPSSIALAINEHGQVVGSSSTAAGRTHAFLWQKSE